MEKLYQLILFLDVFNNDIHELCITEQELTGNILPLFHISSNELRIEYVVRKISNDPVMTMYEYIPESCVRIWKQEYKSSPLQREISRDETGGANHRNDIMSTARNDISKPSWLELRDIIIKNGLPAPAHSNQQKPDQQQAFILYCIKILGVSVKDLLNRERFFFKNIIFTPRQIQKAFDSLVKLRVVKAIGAIDGEIRYTVADEPFKDLVRDCWQVHNWIIQEMNLKWMYGTKKPVKRKEEKQKRDWLELSYDFTEANKMIIDDYTFRSNLDVIERTEGIHCVIEDKEKMRAAYWR